MNKFKLIQSEEIEEFKIRYKRYEHDSTLTLIHCDVHDENDNDNIIMRIMFRTPSLNNKGVTHVIEHCIASENSKTDYIKQSADTYQDTTVYDYIIANKNLKGLRNLVNELFSPYFKKDINVFLREAWRVSSLNGEDRISGIVFNEMIKTMNSPLKTIVRSIPNSLYSGNGYGYVSGGIPEEIIELSYEEVVQYHSRFYVPANCCVFIYCTDCIDKILDIFSQCLDELQLPNSSKFEFHLDRKNIKSRGILELEYSTYVKEEKDNFISLNYAVPKPANQQEYNIFIELAQTLSIDIRFKERIVSSFSNTLMLPYLTAILTYCEKDEFNEFKKYYKFFMEERLIEIRGKEVHNYIRDSLWKNGKVNILYLGKLILEAFFSELDPLAYIRESIYFHKDAFIDKIVNLYSKQEYASEIILSSTQRDMSDYDTMLINKAKKNYIYGEYRPKKDLGNVDSIREKFDATQKEKNTKFKYNCKARNIEGIQCYLYNLDSEIFYLHIYLSMALLSIEEVSLLSIICEYIEMKYEEKDRNKINAITCCFEEEENYFVINVCVSGGKLENEIVKFRTWLFEGSFCVKDIKELIGFMRREYNLLLKEKTEKFLIDRIKSYLSDKFQCQDLLEGLGFFQYLHNCSESNLQKKISDVINKLFISCSYISIYGNCIQYMTDILVALIKKCGLKNEDIKKVRSLNKKNEGFLLNTRSVYYALGCNIRQYGLHVTEGDKLLARVISEQYLVSELRRYCDCYSGGLLLDGQSLIFVAVMCNDINKVRGVFQNTIPYVQANKEKIMSKFAIFRQNLIDSIADRRPNPINDMATLIAQYPNVFKSKIQITAELTEITENQIEQFAEKLEISVRNGYHVGIGNSKVITDKDFQEIMVL